MADVTLAGLVKEGVSGVSCVAGDLLPGEVLALEAVAAQMAPLDAGFATLDPGHLSDLGQSSSLGSCSTAHHVIDLNINSFYISFIFKQILRPFTQQNRDQIGHRSWVRQIVARIGPRTVLLILKQTAWVQIFKMTHKKVTAKGKRSKFEYGMKIRSYRY